MGIIKSKNSSLIKEGKDNFSSIEEVVNFFIPNATKVKPTYVPYGNIGIYKIQDRIFKFSFVHKEAQACARIIDVNDFKNVVKIHSIHKFYLNKNEVNYIIEMESLKKIKKISFDNFDIVELYKIFNFDSKRLLNFMLNFLCCYEEVNKTKMLNPKIKTCFYKRFGLEDLFHIYKGFKNIDEVMFLIENLLKGHMELLSLGIVHNDLHSDNLMIDKDGNYKIIDFGMITLKRKY